MREWAAGRWLCGAALLLLAGCAGSAATDAEMRATADQEIARRPEFYRNGGARAWLVRKDGAERGLLWGTRHVGYDGATVLPGPIRKRFYEAVDLSVETSIDPRSKAEIKRAIAPLKKAYEAADPAAWQKVDPATRQGVEEALPQYVTRRRSLAGLAVLVEGVAAAEPGGPLPTVGFVDTNLMDFSRKLGHPVLSLEPPTIPEFMLKEPNGPDAAADLRLAVRRRGTARALFAQVRSAYGRGEVAETLALLDAWHATPEDLARRDRERTEMLTQRNANWMPKLVETFNRPGQHFVAVGAGHLIGDDGLVALLRRQGFEMTPCLNDACPPPARASS